MEFILLVLITYIGLLIGSLISSFTKEELKQGRKYFKLLKAVVFSVVFYYFFEYLNLYFIISIFLTIILFFISFSMIRKQPNNNLFFYSFFSIVMYETIGYNAVIPLMIFVFGMLSSSIEYDADCGMMQNIKIGLSKNLLYPVLCVILYFIF